MSNTTETAAPKWMAISALREDWRKQFVLLAQAGDIPTKGGRVVEYDYTTDGVVAANKRWVEDVRRMTGAAGATDPADVIRAVPVADRWDTKNEVFRKIVVSIVGNSALVDDLLVARCLSLQEEAFYRAPIDKRVSLDRMLPRHKWHDDLLPFVHWPTSAHRWRIGPSNHQSWRCGYDIEDIQFDATKLTEFSACLIEGTEPVSRIGDTDTAIVKRRRGRPPQGSDEIAAEVERRRAAGAQAQSVQAEAYYIVDWLKRDHPGIEAPALRTISNKISKLNREWRAARN